MPTGIRGRKHAASAIGYDARRPSRVGRPATRSPEIISMKTFVLALALALFAAGPALAISQQDKMKSCNADASKKDLKGDERQKFMSQCLSAEGAPKEMSPQQERMKTCNADAAKKELKGDERKKFMSDCLSGKPAEAAPMTQQDKMKACNADPKAKALKGDERKKFMSECLSK
jgi:psiF repeat